MSTRHPIWIELSLAVVVVAGISCSSLERAEPTPEQVFDRMEQELLSEDRLGFTVHSEGRFESSFEGWLSYEGGELAMAAEGLWAGDPVAVSAETSRDLLVLNTPNRMVRVEREPFLVTAVFVGFARMGVLHNLARLVAGRGPDRADGSIRDWVRPKNIEFVDGDHTTIRFDIFVDGKDAGRATVRIDRETGLPLRRDQTVEFPGGTMTVVETYRY